MDYDLNTIQSMIERVLGKRVAKAKLKTELERAVWVPEVDRMIAVSDNLEALPNTDRYGLFIGMDENRYQISGGRWRYARYLTPEELAKCF